MSRHDYLTQEAHSSRDLAKISLVVRRQVFLRQEYLNLLLQVGFVPLEWIKVKENCLGHSIIGALEQVSSLKNVEILQFMLIKFFRSSMNVLQL